MEYRGGEKKDKKEEKQKKQKQEKEEKKGIRKKNNNNSTTTEDERGNTDLLKCCVVGAVLSSLNTSSHFTLTTAPHPQIILALLLPFLPRSLPLTLFSRSEVEKVDKTQRGRIKSSCIWPLVRKNLRIQLRLQRVQSRKNPPTDLRPSLHWGYKARFPGQLVSKPLIKGRVDLRWERKNLEHSLSQDMMLYWSQSWFF